jgi:hypothetical protein
MPRLDLDAPSTRSRRLDPPSREELRAEAVAVVAVAVEADPAARRPSATE